MRNKNTIIRRLEKSDGECLLKLLLALDSETSFMLYEKGERKNSPEAVSAGIEQINSAGIMLGAEQDGELVGFGFAQRKGNNRNKHSAYIVMGVLKKASGQGLGTNLLEAVDRWALDNGVSKLELTVMVHNTRAFELYKRTGYEVEGIKRNSVIVDGVVYDEYYMGKILADRTE